jgi:transcriptional regulator GlxA family with amidase domain
MSEYIATRRIELAKKLLAATDSQVKEIAHQTGHASRAWFSQAFHAHTGLSPIEYRRRHQR